MAVLFSPFGNQQFSASGTALAVGHKIYTYAAGSSTPLATYTDSTGATPQSNPIILNTLGMPTNGQIWLTSGLSYKLVWTDASDAVIKTEDNISGVTGAASISQWQASGITPTYVSATSFTLPGDQTGEFHARRRLQTSNTSGTIYSTIVSSVYGALTTVTVINDSGVLDSGLSQVSYGLLTAVRPSIPPIAFAAMQSFSGSTTTFTAIPVGTRVILIPIRNMSSTGTNTPLLQLGSSAGLVTSGYLGTTTNQVAGGVSVGVTNGSGFGLSGTSIAAATVHGIITLTLLDAATFLWACAISLGRSDTATSITGGGTIALPGTLDRFAITVGGDTFDAGTIGAIYQ